MKRLLICVPVLVLIVALLSSCTVNPSSPPLSVKRAEGGKSMYVDSEGTEKILALFEEGEWINTAPNCAFDFVFDHNGDTYRYHSECGTFYSLTDERSLVLGEESQADVNGILNTLFD